MSLTLGEKLRQAREERGISISEVSEQTRISSLYLESIENNNYKPLPGGIFNKGFLKTYAKYIGFDEQEAILEYNELMASTEGEDDLRTYKPEVLTDDNRAASLLPSIIIAAVILALMTGGILFAVSYIQNRPASPPATNVNSAVNTGTAPAGNANTGVPATSTPPMGSVRIEFSTTGDQIWLSSNTDGKGSSAFVTAGKSVVFEPKESLRLSYAKSLVQFARLTINGKQIALPQAPANPKRVAIEIEINKNNLSQIWQSGEVTVSSPAEPSATAARPRPSPTVGVPAPGPVTPPATAATPKKDTE